MDASIFIVATIEVQKTYVAQPQALLCCCMYIMDVVVQLLVLAATFIFPRLSQDLHEPVKVERFVVSIAKSLKPFALVTRTYCFQCIRV